MDNLQTSYSGSFFPAQKNIFCMHDRVHRSYLPTMNLKSSFPLKRQLYAILFFSPPFLTFKYTTSRDHLRLISHKKKHAKKSCFHFPALKNSACLSLSILPLPPTYRKKIVYVPVYHPIRRQSRKILSKQKTYTALLLFFRTCIIIYLKQIWHKRVNQCLCLLSRTNVPL
jgi:hypothetical protein